MEAQKRKLVIRGIVTALILVILLAISTRFLFPQFMDPYPPGSKEEELIGDIIGISIWVFSLTVGVLVVVKDWKKI